MFEIRQAGHDISQETRPSRAPSTVVSLVARAAALPASPLAITARARTAAGNDQPAFKSQRARGMGSWIMLMQIWLRPCINVQKLCFFQDFPELLKNDPSKLGENTSHPYFKKSPSGNGAKYNVFWDFG